MSGPSNSNANLDPTSNDGKTIEIKGEYCGKVDDCGVEKCLTQLTFYRKDLQPAKKMHKAH
jgi:hypothetical protein